MTTTTTSVSARFFALAAVFSLGTSLALAQQPSDQGPDPALANLAPGAAAQQNPGAAQQDQSYQQQAPAPIVREAPQPAAALGATDPYNAPPLSADDQPAQSTDPQADANAAAGEAAIDDANLATDQPPPALPDYDQPPAPGDNYIWTPGYWGYGEPGYYWVPGVWINPPYYGALWTPGYWGFYNAKYRWHPGYWGPHIGFYGGVNYGFGYIGVGYFGGYWAGNSFYYNRSVTVVGLGVTNVYNRAVIYNGHTYGPAPVNRISYSGGRGGINVAPRPFELAAIHEQHTAPLPGQVRLHQTAATNPQAAFSANRGHPAVAAQAQPVGATRTISPSQGAFQNRPSTQPRPNAQPRMQAQPQMQQQRAQPQIRPAQQFHPTPQSRPSPPPPHSGGEKH